MNQAKLILEIRFKSNRIINEYVEYIYDILGLVSAAVVWRLLLAFQRWLVLEWTSIELDHVVFASISFAPEQIREAMLLGIII